MNYKNVIEKQITVLQEKQNTAVNTSDSCEISKTIAVLAETASRLPEQMTTLEVRLQEQPRAFVPETSDGKCKDTKCTTPSVLNEN